MHRLQLVILNKIDNIDRHHRSEDFFSQDSVNKNDIRVNAMALILKRTTLAAGR